MIFFFFLMCLICLFKRDVCVCVLGFFGSIVAGVGVDGVGGVVGSGVGVGVDGIGWYWC